MKSDEMTRGQIISLMRDAPGRQREIIENLNRLMKEGVSHTETLALFDIGKYDEKGK